MNTSVVVIGIIMLGFLIIPFIYAHRKRGNQHVQKSNQFEQLIKSLFQSEPLEINVINDTIISLSSDKKVLFYSSLQHIKENFESLMLENYQDCQVIGTGISQHTLPWVGIELSNKNESKKIVFYKDDPNSDVLPKRAYATCKQDAERWKNEILAILKDA